MKSLVSEKLSGLELFWLRVASLVFFFTSKRTECTVGPYYQTLEAGTGSGGNGGDNIAATSSTLSEPHQILYSSFVGGLLVADRSNNRIRKIDDSSGIVNKFAGSSSPTATTTGVAATSFYLYNPYGVMTDSSGNTIITSHSGHQAYRISSSIVSKFAGTGTGAYSGDNTPATSAALNSPAFIHIDSSLQTYIAEYTNGRIRKVSTSGFISTAAGSGSLTTGPATLASLSGPTGVYGDTNGNIYIAEYAGSLVKVINSGIISILAGGGSNFNSGPATTVNLQTAPGVYGDSLGNIFVTDLTNSRVRMLTDGILSTIMGTGSIQPWRLVL